MKDQISCNFKITYKIWKNINKKTSKHKLFKKLKARKSIHNLILLILIICNLSIRIQQKTIFLQNKKRKTLLPLPNLNLKFWETLATRVNNTINNNSSNNYNISSNNCFNNNSYNNNNNFCISNNNNNKYNNNKYRRLNNSNNYIIAILPLHLRL